MRTGSWKFRDAIGGGNHAARPHFWGMAASLVIALISGCQSAPGLVRGQSPAEPQGVAQPVSAMTPIRDPNAYGAIDNTYCDANCLGGSGYYAPRQFYTSTYKVPKNLAYPPPNAPPAVVQYPYYTVKGPDCFFYTGK